MILLTGSTGFIGKDLLESLKLKFGRESLLLLSRQPIKGFCCVIHKNYIDDKIKFSPVDLAKIETIIHLGSFIPKNKSESHNQNLTDLNVKVTKSLLQEKFKQVKRFIYISSIDVYAIHELVDENTPISISNEYIKSKVICEGLIEQWAKDNNAIGQILRLGHVYGPGEEKFQKIIPETIRLLKNKQKPKVFGAGEERRSFIFVKDVSKAIIASLDLEKNVGPINIAGSHSISMINLVKLLIKISGVDTEIEFIEKQDGLDRIVDDNKLQAYLLKKQTSLIDGLRSEWNYIEKKS